MNTYSKIENKYIAAGLDKEGYRLSTPHHLMLIYGYNIEEVTDLYKLNEQDRKFVIDKGIFGLLNSGGLLNREEYLVNRVEKIGDKFKLYTENGYSWLYSNGTIG